jgi:BlaI family transcriptional regulator, penicillinase repressor
MARPVTPHDKLGPRERQIMDIMYRRGRATAEEVREDLADPLTNPAVRGMLRLLEEKGLLAHDQEGPRYVYYPTADPAQVSRSAMRELVRTFYNNSAGSALAAMLGLFEGRMTEAELDRLEDLIGEVRKRGGKS